MKVVASHELVHDGQLVRYLLGLLSDDEAERVDRLSVSSDEVAWRLRIAEDDLVDAYVRGTLDGEAIERFESFYLSTERRRQKVTFARTFVAAIDRRGGSPKSPSLRRATVPRSWKAWRLAAAAAMLLVAGLALREYLRLRTDLTVAQSVSTGLSSRARELERQLNDARQADAETTRELESIRASGSAPGLITVAPGHRACASAPDPLRGSNRNDRRAGRGACRRAGAAARVKRLRTVSSRLERSRHQSHRLAPRQDHGPGRRPHADGRSQHSRRRAEVSTLLARAQWNERER